MSNRCPHTMKAKAHNGETYCCDCGKVTKKEKPMTDERIKPEAYAQPCGCGAAAGQECPHTPIRCEHKWGYSDGFTPVSGTRECEYCGRIESVAQAWKTVRAAFGSPTLT